MKRAPGRPKLPNYYRKTFRVNVPLDREQIERAAAKANRAGMALAAWCRRVIVRARS